MTIYGHMKTINISSLKAHLSESLKTVRSGHRLTVVDRDIPIAEIIPYNKRQSLVIIAPVKKFSLPVSLLHVEKDPVDMLLEDRSSR